MVPDIRFYCLHANLDEHLAHKNWMPFSYKGQLMLVQSINPLHVVTLSKESPPGTLKAVTFSMQPANVNISKRWLWGTLYVPIYFISTLLLRENSHNFIRPHVQTWRDTSCSNRRLLLLNVLPQQGMGDRKCFADVSWACPSLFRPIKFKFISHFFILYLSDLENMQINNEVILLEH